jgi:uncharacterized membrane protein YjjP (DUF1212 family)
MITSQVNQLLSCTLEILQMMLESGAEIYRVEESARRVCQAYGARRADVYATTSNIILSVEVEEDEIKTHTRRIQQISTDIERMDRLNSLVRRMAAECPDLAEVRAEINAIKQTPVYPAGVTILFYGLIAGAFYVFFGGRNPWETLYGALIGIGVGTLGMLFGRLQTNKFVSRFLCSLFACSAAFAGHRLGLAEDVGFLIIGNIMALIPGIGLTNSLRDLFAGDSISGALRMIDALILAASIACGYIVTTFLFGGAV